MKRYFFEIKPEKVEMKSMKSKKPAVITGLLTKAH